MQLLMFGCAVLAIAMLMLTAKFRKEKKNVPKIICLTMGLLASVSSIILFIANGIMETMQSA